MPTQRLDPNGVFTPEAPAPGPVSGADPPTLLVAGVRPQAATHITPANQAAPWTPVSLVPGSLLLDRYQVERRLGVGGTSLVFHVTDLVTGHPMAMKVFNLPETDGRRVARFRQEFRLAHALEHPNIVRLFDMGSDGDLHFLVMELLEGSVLKELTGHRYSPAEGLRLLTHAAVALEYAHAKGVIHRDVKPGNLFLTKRSILKLLDFGLATSPTNAKMTETGALLGTPEYIAPELVTGEHPATPATDLYSLGVIAYELFTGSVPFKHTQLMPLLFMHTKEPPRPPRELNPALPVQFEKVILKMLAKKPADRFANAAELRRALKELWPRALEIGERHRRVTGGAPG